MLLTDSHCRVPSPQSAGISTYCLRAHDGLLGSCQNQDMDPWHPNVVSPLPFSNQWLIYIIMQETESSAVWRSFLSNIFLSSNTFKIWCVHICEHVFTKIHTREQTVVSSRSHLDTTCRFMQGRMDKRTCICSVEYYMAVGMDYGYHDHGDEYYKHGAEPKKPKEYMWKIAEVTKLLQVRIVVTLGWEVVAERGLELGREYYWELAVFFLLTCMVVTEMCSFWNSTQLYTFYLHT